MPMPTPTAPRKPSLPLWANALFVLAGVAPVVMAGQLHRSGALLALLLGALWLGLLVKIIGLFVRPWR